jgi:hypothetical protein
MATLPDHLFVSDCDGCLYRPPNFKTPLRTNYAQHHRQIETVADLKACLRAGDYAWPGGYALFYLTIDGDTLSPASVRREFRNVADSIRNKSADGWRVIAVGTTAELEDDNDNPPICSHTGKPIE